MLHLVYCKVMFRVTVFSSSFILGYFIYWHIHSPWFCVLASCVCVCVHRSVYVSFYLLELSGCCWYGIKECSPKSLSYVYELLSRLHCYIVHVFSLTSRLSFISHPINSHMILLQWRKKLTTAILSHCCTSWILLMVNDNNKNMGSLSWNIPK